MQSSYCKIHKLPHTSSRTEVQCSKQHNGYPEIHLCKLLYSLQFGYCFLKLMQCVWFASFIGCQYACLYRLDEGNGVCFAASHSPEVGRVEKKVINFISEFFMAVCYTWLI